MGLEIECPKCGHWNSESTSICKGRFRRGPNKGKSCGFARLKKEPKVQLSQGVSNRVIYLHLDQFRDNPQYVKTHDGKPVTKNPLPSESVW